MKVLWSNPLKPIKDAEGCSFSFFLFFFPGIYKKIKLAKKKGQS